MFIEDQPGHVLGFRNHGRASSTHHLHGRRTRDPETSGHPHQRDAERSPERYGEPSRFDDTSDAAPRDHVDEACRLDDAGVPRHAEFSGRGLRMFRLVSSSSGRAPPRPSAPPSPAAKVNKCAPSPSPKPPTRDLSDCRGQRTPSNSRFPTRVAARHVRASSARPRGCGAWASRRPRSRRSPPMASRRKISSEHRPRPSVRPMAASPSVSPARCERGHSK